jgi:hypothetical protein
MVIKCIYEGLYKGIHAAFLISSEEKCKLLSLLISNMTFVSLRGLLMDAREFINKKYLSNLHKMHALSAFWHLHFSLYLHFGVL